MGEAPTTTACLAGRCGRTSSRVFGFHFQEDRTRFWRNAKGTRFSSALGEQMPEDKKTVAAVAKAKGVEFVEKGSAPEHFRRAREYGEHVRTGGERISNAEAEAMMSAPQPKVKTIAERLRESNFRMPDLSGPMERRELPAFPKDVV